jgi:hypothetical protein
MEVGEISRELAKATEHARKTGNTRIGFDSGAAELWKSTYHVLSEGRPGLVGAMTGRAEAHCVRLALIYALLDCAVEIREEHLAASLAVWNYCDHSASFIWGDALGDATADEILRAVREYPAGLTRWDLHKLFSGHKKGPELDRGTGVLIERGLLRAEKEASGGRDTTRYRAI